MNVTVKEALPFVPLGKADLGAIKDLKTFALGLEPVEGLTMTGHFQMTDAKAAAKFRTFLDGAKIQGAKSQKVEVPPADQKEQWLIWQVRGDVAVLGERRVLAQEGTVTAILIVSAKTGQIIAGPDLVSRGLVSGDGTSAHMRRARDELAARLRDIGGPYRADAISLKDEVVRTIRGYFSEELGKRPLVVPHVVEV